ncbi:MAG: N-acetylmuramoyl-L-alanine amidase [Marinifilaceae bacterium]
MYFTPKHTKFLNKRLSTPFLFFLLFWVSSPFCYANNEGYRIRTVVIDAGHGGKDPGAIGKRSYEKNIVLAISLKLGHYIEKNFPEVKVLYTRKTDIFIPLDQRSEIANKNNADLFISIHANANRNPRIRGTETYTLGLHKTKENLEVAMKENAVMLYEEDYSTKYEGFDPNNPASYIIFNLLQGINREKSIDLAELTESQFKNRAGRHSRGVREAGFWVLKQASMPSILVEAGFISNPAEEKYLNSKNGQVYLASAIYRAFKIYKKKVESNSTILSPQEEITSEQPLSVGASSGKSITRESSSTQDSNKTNEKKLQYCVQIRSSRKKIPLTSPIFKGLGKVRELKIDGIYKYTIGSTDRFSEIVELQKKTRKKISDCFVIALLNGKRISLPQAKKLQKR